jgi:peptide/nickel transport system permease protein
LGVVRYLATRALLATTTLFLIATITFFATSVVPSDPARAALGKFATTEQLELYREQQGLNEPVLERYQHWLGRLAHGDWGTSLLSRAPVGDSVVPKLKRTIILGGLAMLIAVPLAFAIGVYTGQRSGRPVDVVLSLVALFLNSLPEFVVGLGLLLLLAVHLHALPVESSGASFGHGVDVAEAYVLPVIALALVLTPYIARMVRVNVRDTLAQPFVRSAVLRGLSRRRVIWRHVVPSASLPVVNVVALSLAELVGGVVVIESVFGFPGIGKLLVDSVSGKDIPMVQAIALVIGAGYVLLNFAADAIVLALNPRLRTGG